MVIDNLSKEEQDFYGTVPAAGFISNKKLKGLLGWDPDRYWRVRDGLVKSGLLATGRGFGGRVCRATQGGRRVVEPEKLLSRSDERLTQEEQALYDKVPSSGAIGNKKLREELAWRSDHYFRVRNELIERGLLSKGRGKGGSVSKMPLEETPEPPKLLTPKQAEEEYQQEKQLYPKIREVLQTDWARDEQLTPKVIACVTASQGARGTGGRWTRPDITVVAVRHFELLPTKLLDVITFEVKPEGEWDILGVLEAAAHSRAATRSFLAIHTPKGKTLKEDSDRVTEECKRFGIGLITFEKPDQFDTWTVLVEAERREPDPFSLHLFLKKQLPVKEQETVREWVR